MFIEGVVDVDEEGQLPGKKYSYQGRGRSQTKIRLTKETITILLGKLKGPRSRYANRTPSTLTRLVFALPALFLLLAGATTLDT